MSGKTPSIWCAFALALASSAFSQQNPSQLSQDANGRIPRGAKVYIGAIEGGYDIYLAAAMHKKEVPIVMVTDRARADFELSGVSESEKAGWAKIVFWGNTSVASGEVVFAYSADKKNSAHGRQTTAEACAKHLGEAMKPKK